MWLNPCQTKRKGKTISRIVSDKKSAHRRPRTTHDHWCVRECRVYPKRVIGRIKLISNGKTRNEMNRAFGSNAIPFRTVGCALQCIPGGRHDGTPLGDQLPATKETHVVIECGWKKRKIAECYSKWIHRLQPWSNLPYAQWRFPRNK